MKKIAFINVRYGAGINGGSEVHCRDACRKTAG